MRSVRPRGGFSTVDGLVFTNFSQGPFIRQRCIDTALGLAPENLPLPWVYRFTALAACLNSVSRSSQLRKDMKGEAAGLEGGAATEGYVYFIHICVLNETNANSGGLSPYRTA